MADDLVISYTFPPYQDTSGNVMAKRIISEDMFVDVIQNNFEANNLDMNNIVRDYIDERFTVDIDSKIDSSDCVFRFINEGLPLLNKNYKNIYSRAFIACNHLLAAEYKFRHPDTVWNAEFSDPIILDLTTGLVKDYKFPKFDDSEYVERLNMEIKSFNEYNGTDFDLIDNPNNIYYLAEYLTYIFADKIIFTNVNQREIMLDQYDDEIKKWVMDKSLIKPHPTLPNKYYDLKKTNLELNEDDINIAYFGSFYYSKRHFEAIFYALDSLNHKFKDKIKLYLFITKDTLLKRLTKDLKCSENIIVKKPIDYFEFLNATNKFDYLLINDTITSDVFDINPFLPSKLSDYKGSSSKIWSICERGSCLADFETDYRSFVDDYDSARDVIVKILNESDYADEDYSFDDDYLERRITQLNIIVEEQFKAKTRLNTQKRKANRKVKKLKKENKKLKRDNDELLSSKSWKLTKPLRNVTNKFR